MRELHVDSVESIHATNGRVSNELPQNNDYM